MHTAHNTPLVTHVTCTAGGGGLQGHTCQSHLTQHAVLCVVCVCTSLSLRLSLCGKRAPGALAGHTWEELLQGVARARQGMVCGCVTV